MVHGRTDLVRVFEWRRLYAFSASPCEVRNAPRSHRGTLPGFVSCASLLPLADRTILFGMVIARKGWRKAFRKAHTLRVWLNNLDGKPATRVASGRRAACPLVERIALWRDHADVAPWMPR